MTVIDHKDAWDIAQFKQQYSNLVRCYIDQRAEIERLRKIETAATEWRKSLEGDGWTKEDIESGICRPGVAELMRLIAIQLTTRYVCETCRDNPYLCSTIPTSHCAKAAD
jgi:hypothetical protein